MDGHCSGLGRVLRGIVFSMPVQFDSAGAGNQTTGATTAISTTWTHTNKAADDVIVVFVAGSASAGSGGVSTITQSITYVNGTTTNTPAVTGIVSVNTASLPTQWITMSLFREMPLGLSTVSAKFSKTATTFNAISGNSFAYSGYGTPAGGSGTLVWGQDAGGGAGTTLSKTFPSGTSAKAIIGYVQASGAIPGSFSGTVRGSNSGTVLGWVAGDVDLNGASTTVTATRASGVSWADSTALVISPENSNWYAVDSLTSAAGPTSNTATLTWTSIAAIQTNGQITFCGVRWNYSGGAGSGTTVTATYGGKSFTLCETPYTDDTNGYGSALLSFQGIPTGAVSITVTISKTGLSFTNYAANFFTFKWVSHFDFLGRANGTTSSTVSHTVAAKDKYLVGNFIGASGTIAATTYSQNSELTSATLGALYGFGIGYNGNVTFSTTGSFTYWSSYCVLLYPMTNKFMPFVQQRRIGKMK